MTKTIEARTRRPLTAEDLEAQVALELPARELLTTGCRTGATSASVGVRVAASVNLCSGVGLSAGASLGGILGSCS